MRYGLALLLALAVLPLATCGGSGTGTEDERARGFYNEYRSAEDERTDFEAELRQAFSDIALAAQTRNRAGVLAAVERGRSAAAEIERLLTREIEAADGLAAVKRLAVDADRLKRGLQATGQGLRLFVREFDIAERDPFLDEERNSEEIGRLAQNGVDLAVEGELAIRKADRALARALGLIPRLDRILDNP
jgi:hypothetical protein